MDTSAIVCFVSDCKGGIKFSLMISSLSKTVAISIPLFIMDLGYPSSVPVSKSSCDLPKLYHISAGPSNMVYYFWYA